MRRLEKFFVRKFVFFWCRQICACSVIGRWTCATSFAAFWCYVEPLCAIRRSFQARCSPVYLPCTSIRHFCPFCPFWSFVESTTYVFSTQRDVPSPVASAVCFTYDSGLIRRGVFHRDLLGSAQILYQKNITTLAAGEDLKSD